MKQAILLALLPIILTSCTLPPAVLPSLPIPPTTSAPEPAFVPEPYNVRQAVVQKDAQWLLDVPMVAYRGIPATQALKMVVGNQPLSLLFDPQKTPLVSQPEDALTKEDHLRAICSQANWAYTITNGVILISDTETKTFRLAIQPGVLTSQIQLNSLGQEGSGDDNSSQLVLDPYSEEIESLLNTILLKDDGGESGGGSPPQTQDEAAGANKKTSITILPSANAVTVTAAPNQIRLIETVLQEYTAATAQTVYIAIIFYEVSTTNTNERQLDLNLLRSAASSFGIRINPTSTPAAGSLTFEVDNANSSFDNTRAISRWLNTAGKVYVVFQDSVEVRNNTVATLNATTNRQYVSGISRTEAASGNTTNTTPQVELDELKTGWSIALQPTIVGDKITVNLAISNSNFLDEVPYSFDEGRIAGTNFITSNFNRRMAIQLQHGATKLLASLANSENRDSNARTPWLPGIGDRINTRTTEREIIMLITATIQR